MEVVMASISQSACALYKSHIKESIDKKRFLKLKNYSVRINDSIYKNLLQGYDNNKLDGLVSQLSKKEKSILCDFFNKKANFDIDLLELCDLEKKIHHYVNVPDCGMPCDETNFFTKILTKISEVFSKNITTKDVLETIKGGLAEKYTDKAEEDNELLSELAGLQADNELEARLRALRTVEPKRSTNAQPLVRIGIIANKDISSFFDTADFVVFAGNDDFHDNPGGLAGLMYKVLSKTKEGLKAFQSVIDKFYNEKIENEIETEQGNGDPVDWVDRKPGLARKVLGKVLDGLNNPVPKLGFKETLIFPSHLAKAKEDQRFVWAVAPRWKGFEKAEETDAQLKACYTAILQAAYKEAKALKKDRVEQLVLPIMGSGIFKYPADRSIRLAMEAVYEFNKDPAHDLEMTVVMCEQPGKKSDALPKVISKMDILNALESDPVFKFFNNALFRDSGRKMTLEEQSDYADMVLKYKKVKPGRDIHDLEEKVVIKKSATQEEREAYADVIHNFTLMRRFMGKLRGMPPGSMIPYGDRAALNHAYRSQVLLQGEEGATCGRSRGSYSDMNSADQLIMDQLQGLGLVYPIDDLSSYRGKAADYLLQNINELVDDPTWLNEIRADLQENKTKAWRSDARTPTTLIFEDIDENNIEQLKKIRDELRKDELKQLRKEMEEGTREPSKDRPAAGVAGMGPKELVRNYNKLLITEYARHIRQPGTRWGDPAFWAFAKATSTQVAILQDDDWGYKISSHYPPDQALNPDRCLFIRKNQNNKGEPDLYHSFVKETEPLRDAIQKYDESHFDEFIRTLESLAKNKRSLESAFYEGALTRLMTQDPTSYLAMCHLIWARDNPHRASGPDDWISYGMRQIGEALERVKREGVDLAKVLLLDRGIDAQAIVDRRKNPAPPNFGPPTVPLNKN
jgi:hypothetical protein